MTDRTSKTLKGAGFGLLAALMLFGDWLLEKVQPAPANAVTVERFVADSVAVRAELRDVLRRAR